jgi:hypothetical protein
MKFKAIIKSLHRLRTYEFSNKGLVKGVLCRKTVETGDKKYYTSTYKVFTVYSEAAKLQRLINKS